MRLLPKAGLCLLTVDIRHQSLEPEDRVTVLYSKRSEHVLVVHSKNLLPLFPNKSTISGVL
jgi:hypothetical protein